MNNESFRRFFGQLGRAIQSLQDLHAAGEELFGRPRDPAPPATTNGEPLRVEPVEVREVQR